MEHRTDQADPTTPLARLQTLATATAYIAANVAANLLAAAFGAWITPINALAFIGLDITARDRLHDTWAHFHLAGRMTALILIGALLSAVINRSSTQIAIASFIAFAASQTADTLIYHALRGRPRAARVNLSNATSAVVDSIVFPWLAFGKPQPLITCLQIAAKCAGGYLWSRVL